MIDLSFNTLLGECGEGATVRAEILLARGAHRARSSTAFIPGKTPLPGKTSILCKTRLRAAGRRHNLLCLARRGQPDGTGLAFCETRATSLSLRLTFPRRITVKNCKAGAGRPRPISRLIGCAEPSDSRRRQARAAGAALAHGERG